MWFNILIYPQKIVIPLQPQEEEDVSQTSSPSTKSEQKNLLSQDEIDYIFQVLRQEKGINDDT
jgi:hypothetical protein